MSNAYKDLKLALESSVYGDQIWVAKGTYYPSKDAGDSVTTPRNKFFVLRNGVKIYGGFAGNETILEQKDFTSNKTILSGDIGVSGDISDNSWHVISSINDNLDSNTVLSGFYIEHGNASSNTATSVDNRYGGGIFIKGNSAVTLSDLIVRNNKAALFPLINIPPP